MKLCSLSESEWLFSHPQHRELARMSGSIGGMFLSISPEQNYWHLTNARSYPGTRLSGEMVIWPVLELLRKPPFPLCDNETMDAYMTSHPEMVRSVKDGKQLCFKVEDDMFTYIIRSYCLFDRGIPTLFCYCFGYESALFKMHMEVAERGVSFTPKTGSEGQIKDGQEVAYWQQGQKKKGYCRILDEKRVILNERVYDVNIFCKIWNNGKTEAK